MYDYQFFVDAIKKCGIQFFMRLQKKTTNGQQPKNHLKLTENAFETVQP